MNNDFRVVGITGAARSGKDTIADYLCAEWDFGRIAFADPIKDMLCAMLGKDKAWLERNKDVHLDGLGTPRRMLQTLGTEWGRELINDNIWINLARQKVFDIRNDRSFSGVIFTDCRFNNEARAIQDLDGEIWRVVRESAPQVDVHVSEGGIDTQYIERNLINNSDLWALYDLVESYL